MTGICVTPGSIVTVNADARIRDLAVAASRVSESGFFDVTLLEPRGTWEWRAHSARCIIETFVGADAGRAGARKKGRGDDA